MAQRSAGSAPGLEELYALVRRLREPDGCPWDRKQTPQSLKLALVSEAYEVLEAIEKGSGLAEELGDALLVILLLTAVAEERGEFGLSDVLEGLRDKIVSRHPHVFEDENLSEEEVLARWERSKKKEFPEGVNTLQPSLALAEELGRKAARLGFDWERPGDVLEKVHEEVEELQRALEQGGDVAHELGDALFALTMLARHLELSPEDCLRSADMRFIRRFKVMRELARSSGKALEDMGLEEMEALWQRAKEKTGS